MEKIKIRIVSWLKNYAKQNNMKGFVVGISGGIDSSVTSTLCALTKLPTIAVRLPMGKKHGYELSLKQSQFLKDNFENIFLLQSLNFFSKC